MFAASLSVNTVLGLCSQCCRRRVRRRLTATCTSPARRTRCRPAWTSRRRLRPPPSPPPNVRRHRPPPSRPAVMPPSVQPPAAGPWWRRRCWPRDYRRPLCRRRTVGREKGRESFLAGGGRSAAHETPACDTVSVGAGDRAPIKCQTGPPGRRQRWTLGLPRRRGEAQVESRGVL